MGDWLLHGTLGNELFLNHWSTTALTNCIIYICPPRLHAKKPTFAIIEIHQLSRAANDRPEESDILAKKEGFLEAPLYK